MKTIYVKYYDPREVSDLTLDEMTDKDLINICFRSFKCQNEAQALMVYANTACTWSTLLDDSMSEEDIYNWMLEACNHIRNYNYDWLEQNFT